MIIKEDMQPLYYFNVKPIVEIQTSTQDELLSKHGAEKDAGTPFFLRSPCNEEQVMKQSLQMKEVSKKIKLNFDLGGYESFGEEQQQ